jgi:F0F1-type ATP synthase membrane subunit c/vacuolar-type H+-ATPase subunit K
MNFVLWFFLALVALALLSVGLGIAGCLAAAALFPRGHPAADRLRAFAKRLPGLGIRGAALFEGVVFYGVLLLFAVLTVVYA